MSVFRSKNVTGMSSTKNKGQTSRLTISAKICLILPFQSYHLPHPCFLFGLQTFLPVVLSANLCPLKSYPTCNAFMRVCGLNEAFKNATSYRKGCFFSSAENNLFHSSTPQHIVSTSLYHWSLNVMQPCYLCLSYPFLSANNGICDWSLLQSEETWAQKVKFHVKVIQYLLLTAPGCRRAPLRQCVIAFVSPTNM